MKQKFVPLAKRPKREQKEYHAAQRRDWGYLNPATRKTPNLKAYNRKKSKQRWHEHEPCLDFYFVSNYFILAYSRLYPFNLKNPTQGFHKIIMLW
ncbi:MAG: hypothetical protein FWC76_02145 [Defluviitaleaceae bacterium]|nr:hypothetical protein [Defluviitaleaceae bacterium]